MVRLLLLLGLTAITFTLDLYFENHPLYLEEFNTGNSEDESGNHTTIYLFSQSSNIFVKSVVQKSTCRKFADQEHTRLLQKCHQLRNFLALKIKIKVTPNPLFLTYYHLIFRQYYFACPDDETFFH